EHVGEDLAGVVFVGEAVDDRHPRMRCEGLDLGLLEGPDHDDVDHPADDARRVFDRLGAAELAVAGRQVHDRAAHLVHARLEAHAGARRGLLEDHRQRPVDERRVLLVVLEVLLDRRRALEQIRVFLGAEVPELEEVLDHAAPYSEGALRNSLISGQRMATICAASSREMISAGSRRTTRSAVTLIMSPASAAWPSSTPQGRPRSMPIIRPWPRTSTTPATPASSCSSPLFRRAPTLAAFSSRRSSSMMRSVSTPARVASGLPPKVEPWLPGPITSAARGPQTTAPI